jgi:hypothetical protein
MSNLSFYNQKVNSLIAGKLNQLEKLSLPVKSRLRKIRLTSDDRVIEFFRNQDLQAYEPVRKKEKFLDDDEELKNSSRYALTYSVGGRLVELKRLLGHKPAGLGKSIGDIIDSYSRESRNRFIKLLMSIDYTKVGTPLFYTITYPGEYSSDPKVWKRDLRIFYDRLNYKFPDMFGTWRLEPQRRGAPHFCGFLWGCPGLETMEGKKWFSLAWYEVVGSGDEKHLRAGTGIEVEKDIQNRIFYMAKYQTKSEKGGVKQEFDYPVGRYWGVWNRKKLEIQKEEFDLDTNLFFKIRRVIKKKLERRLTKNKYRDVIKGKSNGLWVSMSNDDILRLIDYIVREQENYERSAVIPPLPTRVFGSQPGALRDH